MKKYEKYSKIKLIVIVVSILIWISGWFFSFLFNNEHLGGIILLIGGGIIGILFIIEWFMFLIIPIAKAYLERCNIIAIILLTISIIIMTLGLTIFLIGEPIIELSTVDTIKVIDTTQKNKVVIDYSRYSHNSIKVKEISLPFYKKVKPGDTIDVKYKNGKPETMHYVISSEYGKNMLKWGGLLFGVVFIIGLIKRKN